MSNDTTITAVGNLAAVPKLAETKSGRKVANFDVASTPRSYDKVSESWKDGETLWLRCSVWGAQADNVALLPKGCRVVVIGNLVQRGYEKDGEKRTAIELQVSEVSASLLFATVAVTRAAVSSQGPDGFLPADESAA